MLKYPHITEERIAQFIRNELEPKLMTAYSDLRLEFCADSCAKQPPKNEEFICVGKGFRWGFPYQRAWFRATGMIPKSWAGKNVVAQIEIGTEGNVWRGNTIVGGIDRAHPYFRVTENAKGGEKVELYIRAYGRNPNVRVHGKASSEWEEGNFEIGETRLCVFDSELWQFYLDCRFAYLLMKTFPEEDVARAYLRWGLNEAINAYDSEKRENLSFARKAVKEAMSQKRVDRYHKLTPVGHAHLDTAWLWPLEITKEKMAHTTAIQLSLMEQHPDYVFVHSQAEQYQWLEEEYPKLFERVKDKVAGGQWEPLGSTWVEPDTNIPSGESLVRQILYGKRYFLQKFNVDTKDLWLPDCFGYSGALPQILVKSGIEFFVTQKLSWNQFNPFPHTNFWWQGIDGSRVRAHLPPADTYTGNAEPQQLLRHIQKNKDFPACGLGLYIFGHGDGGGGPTEEMIEFLKRASRAPGMPQIEWRKASEFYEEAKSKCQNLPVWVGELYFELHRGTYTTQAKTKRNNRFAEIMLRDAELLACFDPEYPISYPSEELTTLWKKVLLNQFHDILPGSSVREVYEQSEKDYEEVFQKGESIIENSLRKISAEFDTSHCTKPVALFQLSSCVTEARMLPPKGLIPHSIVCENQALPVQLIEEFGEKYLIFPLPEAAMNAVALADLSTDSPTVLPRFNIRPKRIENEFWTVRFDQHGNITSVVSVEDGTEYIAPGALANVFQLFEDKPLGWSAWDVDAFALETCKDLLRSDRVEIVETGPVRVAIEIEKRFGNSRLVQRISLGPTPGIRFDTWVDWHEEEKMLKVAFPVNIHSNRASFEVQFGHIERPTHRNTSWDIARFEVCCQKWFDISEGDQGVALLNDCKYGCDVLDNVLRLTLLRAPKAPDPEADMGEHRFTYVLLPHFGTLPWSGVVQAAYALNSKLRYCFLEKKTGTKTAQERFLSCDDRNVVIESVKKAEDSANLIVRMYECHNARGRAELRCSKQLRAAYLCDLMENDLEELDVSDNAVVFDYKPFEIITVKLVLGKK